MSKKSKPKREGCPPFFIRKAKECIFIPFNRYMRIRKQLSNYTSKLDDIVKKGKEELKKAQKVLEKEAKAWEKKHPNWRK